MKKVIIILFIVGFTGCTTKPKLKEEKKVESINYTMPLGFHWRDSESKAKENIQTLLKNNKISSRQLYTIDGIEINGYGYDFYYGNEFCKTVIDFEFKHNQLSRMFFWGSAKNTQGIDSIVYFLKSKYGTPATMSENGYEWKDDFKIINFKPLTGSNFYLGFIDKSIVEEEEKKSHENYIQDSIAEAKKREVHKNDFK